MNRPLYSPGSDSPRCVVVSDVGLISRMATIPRNPDTALLEHTGVRASGGLGASSLGGRSFDALQALLAFSALHEQVRARRAAGNSEPEENPFVLYEVLQLVAERALKLTGADGVAIALVQEGEIICRAATGAIAPEIGARLDPHSGLSGTCFRTGELVRCDDAENDPRVDLQASRQLHARSMIAVPLRGRRSVIGLLEAFCAEAHGFDDSDVRSLTLLAELILGAMKPEEEERLEALSPIPIQPVPAPEEVKTEPKLSTRAAHTHVPATEVLPDDQPAANDLAPALLPAYDKAAAWPGLMLVAAIVFAALTLAGGLWWKFHNALPQPVSAAAAAPTSQPQQPALPSATPSEPLPVSASLPELTVSPKEAQRSVLPMVTGIRHWEAEDSTTVVIDLQDQVQYEVHRLSSPERIYFDLHDTVLGQGYNGKTIEVSNPLLSRIRVAQPVPGVSRVVLETKNVSNFSVGLAPNPYRLTIEISSSQHQKTKMDLPRPAAPAEHAKAASATLTAEDRALRARIRHLKVVIDAGHGGWDLGTVGRQGLLEKDLVLDVAQRLGKLLEDKLGGDVLYTRANDIYVPLEQRAEIANDAQADLFVSIHANNSDYPSARGVETYYTNVAAPANSLEIEKRENATASSSSPAPVLTTVTLKERTDESRRLAESVERALHGSLASRNPAIRDRGVKEAAFVVLTSTAMPAILAEVSFVSSPADERNLQSPSYRQQIAEALYKGVARYAAGGSHLKLASARGVSGSQ